MRLLEYQAKSLFADYNIPIPKGLTSTDIVQGRKDAAILGFPFVIKAQMAVGGRGKAGAIQKCQNADEFELKYPDIMQKVVKGEKTKAILLEKMADIKKELYLSLFLNRGKRCYTIIASGEGGVEIESVKNQIIREVGLGTVDAKTAEEVGKPIGLKDKPLTQFIDILQKLAKITIEKEAEVSELEERAEKSGFSLVELDGNIAVVGNGAGLVMSTLDMLSDNGGKPACFLDVGGGATTETVYEALTLISKMKKVKGILVNLYGGIVKTTTVATAFIKAYDDKILDLPVFARMSGAEADKSKEMLKGSRTKMFDTIEEAINAAVIEMNKNG